MPRREKEVETKDFLIRGLPREVANKLKVAASLHHIPMKDYIQKVLEDHLKELERRGITLKLPSKKSSK